MDVLHLAETGAVELGDTDLLSSLRPLGVTAVGCPAKLPLTGQARIVRFEGGAAFRMRFDQAVCLRQQARGLATFLCPAAGLSVDVDATPDVDVAEQGLLYTPRDGARLSIRNDTCIVGLVVSTEALKEHRGTWFPGRDAPAVARPVERYSRSRADAVERFLGVLLSDAGDGGPVLGEVSRGRCRAALLDILVEAVEEEEPRSDWALSPGHLKRAEAFILANLSDSITAADVAREAGVSPRSLYRAFQDFRGLSFSQFVRNVRMDAARELLRKQPGVSLKAVAQRVGYADYTSFWRHFRARFGVSPRAEGERLAA